MKSNTYVKAHYDSTLFSWVAVRDLSSAKLLPPRRATSSLWIRTSEATILFGSENSRKEAIDSHKNNYIFNSLSFSPQ